MLAMMLRTGIRGKGRIKMKKIGAIIVVIIILAVFNRCSQISSLSGTYVNEQDSSEYLKFSGESTVTLHADGKKYTGTYSIYDNAVMLTFSSNDDIESVVLEIKSKKVLSTIMGLAYVKRTFWNYYWKRWLLWSFILSVAYYLFKKIFLEHKGINDIAKEIKDEYFDT